MHSSSAHRHSSIDLSFEEGFSFLEAEASDSKQPTKASESHWLFDRDDALDAFLPNSPSQSRTSRLTTELIPSYAQQTFTSSLATSKKQELSYTSPATSRSLASPSRQIQATPPNFRNDRESNTYTPPVDRKRKRSLASSPFESTTQTNAMDEIVENALSSEEAFIPLSERLRRYEEEVEVKSVGNSPDKRRVQSPQSARVSPKRLSSISPAEVDTAQAERASIGSLHRSPDHLMKTMSKISPNNLKRARSTQHERADELNLQTSKIVSEPVVDRCEPVSVPVKADITQNSNHTFGTRQLRVIDDIPPIPEPKSRRKTMSDRPRSQISHPQPLSRTIPQPFTFATDIRGEQHQRQFQEKLRQWQEREQDAHKFKPAGPPPRFDRPFQVKRSTKPLTEAQNVVFHSEIRSLERKMAEDERRLQEQLDKATNRKRRRTTQMSDRTSQRLKGAHRLESPASTSRRSTKVLTTPKSPNFSLTRSERRAARDQHSNLEHSDIRRWSESISGDVIHRK